MFNKILIANRGEIACRVIDTARRMGIKTVAVYSDADAGARHVAMADEAVHIGGAAPADSYLRGDVILQAAHDTQAQAIHPGYGFLSENPDFVDACDKAGVTFIGPSAAAIRAMGLKDAAKALMQKAGVPVVPGYHGADQADDLLADEAQKIGYPVLIKAVAGGGGKGMRLVESATDFQDALMSARAEARTAFGNDAVLVEKYVTKPRHIEVQVFGDGSDAVHLFERDCSLQRRHQKVIEEAPAPGMTDDVRAAMGEAAVRAARAIGYSGAGTIEFIVDGSNGLRPDGFWFMEMNTRLQVEHPVTEMITDVDLVEWQLRVAAGETLPKTQDELQISGHAFEARLYAEDVPAGFLPATGRLSHLAFAPGARADTGVRPGDDISPFYDPMIAKLITHGPTRSVALMRMQQALADTQVAGTVTNLEFLGALAAHDGFVAGDVDTGLIARDIDALTARPDPTPRIIATAAMAGAGLLNAPRALDGFHLWSPMRRIENLRYKDEEIEISLTAKGQGCYGITIADQILTAEFKHSAWQIDGQRAADVAIDAGRITVFGARTYVFDHVAPLDREAGSIGDGNVILAPMPGLVRDVLATAGQSVSAGDKLAVLEAMKMEHALLAARDGVVAEVLVAAGDQVEGGAALIALEPEGDAK